MKLKTWKLKKNETHHVKPIYSLPHSKSNSKKKL